VRNPIAYVCMAAAAALLGGCGSSAYSGAGSSSAKSTSTASGSASSGAYAAGAAPGAYGTGAAAGSAGATAVTITTKHAKLGTVLAGGPKRLTVYLFEADRGPSSTCSGACAAVWPPVTSSAAATASGQAVAADLGTTRRADGTSQITYKGHPLYYYARDKDAGDSYGEGLNSFGGGWYVLAPSGTMIDSESKGGGRVY
jgi:predicted lipoprotein with Yx(FWY)xxD motif